MNNEQGTRNNEQGTMNNEQGTRNKEQEQGTRNKEQGTRNNGFANSCFKTSSYWILTTLLFTKANTASLFSGCRVNVPVNFPKAGSIAYFSPK